MLKNAGIMTFTYKNVCLTPRKRIANLRLNFKRFLSTVKANLSFIRRIILAEQNVQMFCYFLELAPMYMFLKDLKSCQSPSFYHVDD